MALIKNYNVGGSIDLPDAPTADNHLTITSINHRDNVCKMQSAFTTLNASLQSGANNTVHFCGLHSDGTYTDDTVTVSGTQTHTSNLTNPTTIVAGYFYETGSIGINLQAWLS